MGKAFRSLGRFLLRALVYLPQSIGSNHLGILFPAVPAILFFGYQWHQHGWQAMRSDLLVGLVITFISYGLLLLYCVVRNVYTEHVSLKAEGQYLESELEYMRGIPLWQGHESEEAWRASIDEQNRLINLGHFVDGIFDQLQIEAIKLATDMRAFVSSFEPIPEYTGEKKDDELALRIKWRERFRAAYKLNFDERERQLLLKFQQRNLSPGHIEALQHVRKLEEEIKIRAANYVAMAHQINGVNLQVREQ
jgi:hypothetical protein